MLGILIKSFALAGLLVYWVIMIALVFFASILPLYFILKLFGVEI